MACVSHSNKLHVKDTEVVTSSTKTSLLNLFENRSDCKYTPYYCEENIWKLCSDVRYRLPAELQSCYVVFVSNNKRTVPLWRQRNGKKEEKIVVWDYHVIFLYAPDDRCLVYDLDSELPFPTHFHKYVTETFRTDHVLKPDYFRYFRVLAAPVYLQHFSSDRRHMKCPDGTWKEPPPDYPPISTSASAHNLEEFINMDPTKGQGEVLNLVQLVHKFYPKD